VFVLGGQLGGVRHQLARPSQIVGLDVDVHRTHGVGAVMTAAQLPQHAFGTEAGDQHPRLELVKGGEQPHHTDIGHMVTLVRVRRVRTGKCRYRAAGGAPHLRSRERVRRDLHPQGPAPPVT
jgi:hypothetical protein